MTTLSIRGLEERCMGELKRRAEQDQSSVNTLVVRLIEQGLGLQNSKPALRRFADLDSLAGTWSPAEAAAFEQATAAFSEIDASLWK